MTIPALVDQDIQPFDQLADASGDDFDLTLGVGNEETELIDALVGKRVLFTTSRLKVTDSVLDGAPDLELVAKIGTGIDSIDIEAANERGVSVMHTPGLNALSVAEHAVTLMLTISRNVRLSQEEIRGGKWRDNIELGDPIVGRTIGLIGFGNVGSRVAGLLAGFNVEILAYDPYVHEIDTEITGATLTDFDTVVESADALVVVAELTDETRGMINMDVFDRMKDSAILVNVARGPIVNQSDLVHALEQDLIKTAALDVFEEEPLDSNHILHQFDDVVLTPHIAGTASGTRERIISTLVGNARRFFHEERIADRFFATERF